MKLSVPNERREAERIAVRLPVKIILHRKNHTLVTEGIMLDLSFTGAMLRSPDEIRAGEEITLEFAFSEKYLFSARIERGIPVSEEEEVFVSPSMVRWNHEKNRGHLVGIEFIGLNESQNEVIKRVLIYFRQLYLAGVIFENPA